MLYIKCEYCIGIVNINYVYPIVDIGMNGVIILVIEELSE